MNAPRAQVLVVDDDALVARLVVRQLAALGFDATVATNLAEARVALVGGGFAAVLCDNALGDGDGLTLVAEMKAGRGGPPVVMMSGSAEVLAMAQARHGIATLMKPMTLQALSDSLRQAGVLPA